MFIQNDLTASVFLLILFLTYISMWLFIDRYDSSDE